MRLLTFINTTALIINNMPIHCNRFTGSFNRMYANNTDTGSSTDAMMVPNPMPVCGMPLVNNNGGRIVPKKAKKMPHGQKMWKLKLLYDVVEKIRTMIVKPPASNQRLLFIECRCVAMLLEEYNEIV